MGGFTAAGMLVMMGRLGAAAPTSGFGLELDAIVAVVVGGASFRGGSGRLRETAFGVLFLGVLNDGLSGLQMSDAGFRPPQGQRHPGGSRAAGRGDPSPRTTGAAMTVYPTIDYGHTGMAAAFERRDVYAVAGDPVREARRPLRLGLAGCGGIAQAKWLPAIRRLQTLGEPLILAGVTDPDEGRRSKVARLWSIPAYAAPETMVKKAGLDLLLVLTADAAHGPVARLALGAGIPCLVEKPLCPTYAEAAALCDAAERQGVLLAGVANKRFAPPYELARRLIVDGALHGPPRVFTGKFVLGYPYVDLLSGGTVHLLDLMAWLMGPVARVHARATADRDGPESIVASIAFESGAIGTVATSAAALSFKPWERVEIIGRHASLTVEDAVDLALCDDETGPTKLWRPIIPNTLLFDESFGGYTGLLDHVLDAVRGEAHLGPSGRDASRALALVEAIRHSLARGHDIDLQQDGLA